MRKNLKLWQFAGFTIAVALGSLFHFLFEWTGLLFLAPISAVNESTWEHMKILFFPMLIFAVVQYFFFRKQVKGFWWIKLIGIIVGVVSVPILFYTCNGAFGKTPDWLNITFFFLAAGLAYFVEYLLFYKDFSVRYSWIAVLILAFLAGLFVLFTFYPPKLPLFQDPIFGTYGLKK